MRRALKLFLAYFRLSKSAVCDMSLNSARDFHDYPDSIQGGPWHFVTLYCKRCGKGFTI
jgi:hypothetical protein